jgi:hypothetical protein
MNNIPYTYLIGWTKLNVWYYGVRYAKDCHPSDLWVSYKTSSNYVKNVVRQHGDPDIVQVRKLFTDVNKARLWEETVLRRMNVINDDKWLNKTSNKSFEPMYGKDNPMKRPEVVAKHQRAINSIEWRTKREQAAKDPAVREKNSGANHYSKRPGYVCKTIGNKNPMKCPEVVQKVKDSLPCRKGENNARTKLNANDVISIRAELAIKMPANPSYGEAGPILAAIAAKYQITAAAVNRIRFRRSWTHI